MILTQEVKNITKSEELEEMEFGISSGNQIHIMNILRNKLYSDKLLAIIREISTNAMDAHIDAGKPNLPIKVTLPSNFDPLLKIRDYGKGLSPEEMKEVFCQYGESTKRNTNKLNGALGLGCKSPFCYVQSFTVETVVDGIKYIYTCYNDGVGSIALLDKSPTPEQFGVEISIPIQTKDIPELLEKAKTFYSYWPIKPDINLTFPEKEVVLQGSGWELNRVFTSSGYYNKAIVNCIALMAGVSYPINSLIVNVPELSGLNLSNSQYTTFDPVKKAHYYLELIVTLPNGSADFSASRESLEYTDLTTKTLKSRLKTISDENTALIEAKALKYTNIFDCYRKLVAPLSQTISNIMSTVKWKDTIIQEYFNPNRLFKTKYNTNLPVFTIATMGYTTKVPMHETHSLHSRNLNDIKFVLNDYQGKDFNRRVRAVGDSTNYVYLCTFESDLQQKQFEEIYSKIVKLSETTPVPVAVRTSSGSNVAKLCKTQKEALKVVLDPKNGNAVAIETSVIPDDGLYLVDQRKNNLQYYQYNYRFQFAPHSPGKAITEVYFVTPLMAEKIKDTHTSFKDYMTKVYDQPKMKSYETFLKTVDASALMFSAKYLITEESLDSLVDGKLKKFLKLVIQISKKLEVSYSSNGYFTQVKKDEALYNKLVAYGKTILDNYPLLRLAPRLNTYSRRAFVDDTHHEAFLEQFNNLKGKVCDTCSNTIK